MAGGRRVNRTFFSPVARTRPWWPPSHMRAARCKALPRTSCKPAMRAPFCLPSSTLSVCCAELKQLLSGHICCRGLARCQRRATSTARARNPKVSASCVGRGLCHVSAMAEANAAGQSADLEAGGSASSSERCGTWGRNRYMYTGRNPIKLCSECARRRRVPACLLSPARESKATAAMLAVAS